jgi:CRISPR-associated endonuclease/helicase Cas3
MTEYYRYYFHDRAGEMSYTVKVAEGTDDNLFNLLSVNSLSVSAFKRIQKHTPKIAFRQSFKTAAKAFRAIDSPTRGVVVPYGVVGQEIIRELCGAFALTQEFHLLKRAQRYTVNLFPHEFAQLLAHGAIREVQKESGIFCLNEQYYDPAFGWQSEIVSKMEPNFY